MLNQIESILNKKLFLVILILTLVSLTLRCYYYNEIKYSPITDWHLWQDSDMHFFHKWTQNINSGDWLTDISLHPYHQFHSIIAQQAFPLKNKDTKFKKNIWNKWYGEKTFHQEPLYAYILAFIYKITDQQISWVFFFQFLLGILSTILVFLITRIHFKNITALIAALICLLYGPFKLYETSLLRVSLITFTLLLALWLTIIALKMNHIKYFFAAGFAFGLAFLTKTTILLFLMPTIILIFYLKKEKIKQAALFTSCLLIAFIATISPGVIRNIIVGVKPLSFSSVGAITFINSNAPDFKPGSGGRISSYAGDIMKETQGNLLASIYKTLQKYPHFGSYLFKLGQKIIVFWKGYEIPNNLDYYYCSKYSPLLTYGQITFVPIGILGLLGLFIAIKNIKENIILYTFVIIGICTQISFCNLSRLRIPIIAILIPFMSYTIFFIIQKIIGKEYIKIVTLSGILLILHIFFNVDYINNNIKIRSVDYLLSNHIGMIKIRKEIQKNNLYEAKKIALKCIETKPSELKNIKKGSVLIVNKHIQKLALSYGKLHLWCSLINKELKCPKEAQKNKQIALKLKKIAMLNNKK